MLPGQILRHFDWLILKTDQIKNKSENGIGKSILFSLSDEVPRENVRLELEIFNPNFTQDSNMIQSIERHANVIKSS